VDEAIRLTIASGCDTCIVVAHREAIRDMAKMCSYHGRIAHPYCCIGIFDVTYERFQPVQYQLLNVLAGHHIGRHSLHEILPASISSNGKNTTNVMFLIPGQTEQLICTIKSRLDRGRLGPQIWLSTKKDARVGPSRSHDSARCKLLNLKIIQGHHLWNHYLTLLAGEHEKELEHIKKHIVNTVRRKQRCELWGWAHWILPGGKKHLMRVRVTPQQYTHTNAQPSPFATLQVFY